MSNRMKLDAEVFVDFEPIRFCKNFQLDGVRFLYQNYKNKLNCILNDESGLGKCYQSSVFLSAIIKDDKNCLIISSSTNKLHHWMYHLHILTNLRASIINFSDSKINLVTFDELEKHESVILDKHWETVILDDIDDQILKSDLFEYLTKIKCDWKILLASVDLQENFIYFLKLLKFLKPKIVNQDYIEKLHDDQQIGKHCSRKDKFEVITWCRSFYLRRYCKDFRLDLPLIDKKVFESNFSIWREVNLSEMLSTEETLVPAQENHAEIVKNVMGSGSTINMSPLLFHSADFDENKTIIDEMDINLISSQDSDILTQRQQIVVEETQENCGQDLGVLTQKSSMGYEEFGQELSGDNENNINHNIASSTINSDLLKKYNFPCETILNRSSSEVEIISNRNSVVIISSSSEDHTNRKSPDLFEDTDNDEQESDNTPKIGLISPFSRKTRRFFHPSRHNLNKFSTPLNNLINGNQTIAITQNEDTSASDIFKDISCDPVKVTEKSNVFEITENKAFPNVIQIHSDEEFSPLKETTPEKTRKLDDLQKTPSTTSSRSSPPWLSARKGTVESSGSNSSTPKKSGSRKRKKLELWFNPTDVKKSPSPSKRCKPKPNLIKFSNIFSINTDSD